MRSRDFFVTQSSGEPSLPGDSSNQIFIRFVSDVNKVDTALEVAANVHTVQQDFQPLKAQFGPFKLVQSFVNAVLDRKPARIVVQGLSGASADLARISAALGIETALTIPDASVLEPIDAAAQRWTLGLLSSINYVVSTDGSLPDVLRRNYPRLQLTRFDALPPEPMLQREGFGAFGYESYAFGMRDHALLTAMQQGLTEQFAHCQNVLDVGCGTGVFLECLQRVNISAMGVERNAQSARFARSLGLKVTVQDALDFLAEQHGTYDGIYCSHFVEHLPFGDVDRLVKLVAQTLQPGGKAIFVFPDPESIRSQLLGFWRDPEHVRFYHPDILSVLGRTHGLALVYNSQDITGRTVGSFSSMPPELDAPVRTPSDTGLWRRMLERIGIVHVSELHRETALRKHLQKNLEQLWAVNQTWAWEDNATLVFRKTAHG